MFRCFRNLTLWAVVPLLALPAWAKKPVHKGKSSHSKAARSKKSSSSKTVKGDGKHRPDPEVRALVRKSAPFYIEERFRGDTIRVNKDGTFSRQAETGGYVTEGHWKISSGKMKMKWVSGEEYGYRMTFSGRTPLIVGHKPSKPGHYTIISMD